MPQNKNQHFVPKCYLKPFSLNAEGKAINMFHISSRRFIQDVSVKGQCAKDYFYGEDLRLERILSNFEISYASVLIKLHNNEELNQNDLHTLREFAHIQHMRTEESIKHAKTRADGFNNALSDNVLLAGTDQIETSHSYLMKATMVACLKSRPMTEDLSICICENNTNDEFLTSDDPSIFTSRYQHQKLRQKSFGLGAAGALFFLPLTPQYLLMCYDEDVYKIPNKQGCFVKVKKNDVLALNELQIIKSPNNIYFSDWSYRDSVLAQFRQAVSRRPKEWTITRVLVRNPHGEGYISATEEEINSASDTLIHQSIQHPDPKKWISQLKYKYKPKTYSDGSAIGHVRKATYERINKGYPF